MYSKVCLHSFLFNCFLLPIIGTPVAKPQVNLDELLPLETLSEKSSLPNRVKPINLTSSGHDVAYPVKLSPTDNQRYYAFIKRSFSVGHSNFKPVDSKTLANKTSPLHPPLWVNINIVFTLITLSNSSSTKWSPHHVLHIVAESHTLQFRCLTLSGRCRVRVIQQRILSNRRISLARHGKTPFLKADFHLLNRQSIAAERIWSTLTATLLAFLIALAAVFAYMIRICFEKLESQ